MPPKKAAAGGPGVPKPAQVRGVSALDAAQTAEQAGLSPGGKGRKPKRASIQSLMDGKNIYDSFKGEAHKIFAKYSENNKTIVKQQLLAMMTDLVRQGRFWCSSQAKLAEFCDKQFSKFDINRKSVQWCAGASRS